MTNDKVNAVLDAIVRDLPGVKPARANATTVDPSVSDAFSHVLWMANEARQWGAERIEKKMRWLGFIQGVLWSKAGYSIEELKDTNKSGEEHESERA